MAYAKCLLKARSLHTCKQLISIDVKNAFNSLPFKVIENTLRENHVCLEITSFILKMLNLRYSMDI